MKNYLGGMGNGLAKTSSTSLNSKTILLTVLMLMPMFMQKLTAATKAEIAAWLDAQDGIMPGETDSLQYTGVGARPLTLGDRNQNDGQTVKMYVNGQEVLFDNSLFVGQNAWVRVEGFSPGGRDDFNVSGVGDGQIEGGVPLALGITEFKSNPFDKTTRRPSFYLELASSKNTDYLYIERFNKLTNTWEQWSDNIYIEGDFQNAEERYSIEGYPFPNNVHGSQLFRLREKETSGSDNVYNKLVTVNVERGGELTIWPNPASTQCTIDYGPDLAGELIVFDTHGDILFRTSYEGTPYILDVSRFASGLHGVQVIGQDGAPVDNTFGKFIKID